MSKHFVPLFNVVALVFLTATVARAQTAPTLGTAQGFAVLGAAAVTNTGPTIINGDLGVSPGAAITGFPPGIVNGTIHAADAVAAQAHSDANTAYNSLAGQPCNTILTGQDLGGMTLVPGVYCFASSAQLSGTLTLNGQGNPNAIFIFKIGSTLTTATNSSVVFINGGTPCNVFFQVGSSATLGTGTQFSGNIFALASVTLTTTANIAGRAIALNGAVTLDSNVVSPTTCAVLPLPGFVQVCKVAGAGFAVGTNTTFNVAGAVVTLAAGAAPGGNCSSPVSVPAGTAIVTETVPGGSTVTSISTLPNPGLLVSSNLPGGTATVTVTPGGQTIVTFIDAAIPPPPNGFVQVCKVAGAGVTVGANFTFNVAGTPVTVAAGAAPLGTCATPISVPVGTAVVTETLPMGTSLAGVSTLPSPGLLVSSNLGAGTATVTVVSGGQTIVTFIDTIIPVIPTNGTVQVCKVAGAGVAVGTSFTFNVGGTPVTVAAGSAPGGACATPVSQPAGNVVVTETIPGGTLVAGVSTLPVGLLVSSNLAAGTATVSVSAGGQTIVTFVDAAIPAPNTGFVQVCKVAGAGVTVGTNFTFNVAGTPVTVPAGAAPGGSCSTPVTVPAGNAVVTETIPGGVILAGVSTLPNAALLVSSNLPAGTATVTVVAGIQTIVTFIDAAIVPPPPVGFVQVCKVAGAGVAPGTNFTFDVGGTPVTVAAGAAPGGACAAPVAVPPGAAVVTETIPGGTFVAGISTLPSAGLLVSSNLAAGTATVTVPAGGQIIVTFIDAAVVIAPATGFLQVCKVAGANIPVGTVFTFNVGGTPVTVAAGPAPLGTCATPVILPAGPAVVTEAAVPGVVVAGIGTLPTPGLLVSSDPSTRTATVTVVNAAQTIVTFVNAVATTGLVQVCKVAGAGVAVGTPFTFTFAGTTVTIPAGATPGSSCTPALVAPVGPALITEAPPANAQADYQIRYASNLNVGDSVVNLTNTGTLTNPGALTTSGNICVNVYTFDASEELISCCSCMVTPNGLNSLSVKQDLVSNTLTPGVPNSVVIKLLASIPLGLTPAGTGGTCNPSSPNVSNLLPSGMKAWGTTLHSLPTTPLTYGLTETPFEPADLGLTGASTITVSPSPALLIGSNPVLGNATVTVTPGGQTIVTYTNALGSAELTKLTTFCSFIQANGSGFGICKSCRTGGLGAAGK